MKALPYYGAELIPCIRWRDTPYRWDGDLNVKTGPLKHTRAWRQYRERVGVDALEPPPLYLSRKYHGWIFGTIHFALGQLEREKHMRNLAKLDRMADVE